jgi:hypothetical protein
MPLKEDPMSVVTGEQVRSILGPTEDAVVVRILALRPTYAEVAAAYAWLNNNEAPMNVGQPLASGKIAEIIDILETAAEDLTTASLY